MPFKYDPEISDEIDQKIISILYFGRKRQNEIVSMIDNSESTIIDHLEYLVDHHKVERYEKNNQTEVYYELEDGRKEIVPPYPLADNERIFDLLLTIKDNLTKIVESELYANNTIQMGQESSKDVESDIIELIEEKTQTDKVVDEFLKATSDFYQLTTKRYHILSNEKNFELFLDILDIVLDEYEEYQEPRRYINHPSRGFDNFIMGANELYINYENSEENEMYASELSNRSSEIVDLVYYLPSHLGDSLMVLAFVIDQNNGQKAFKNAIKSGNYSTNKLVLRAFEKYIQRGHTDVLFEHLKEVEEADDGRYKNEAEAIRKEIRKRYYQVSNSSELER